MWPSISIPFGDQTAQVYTYSLMVGLGLCHLLIGVDAAGRRAGLPREEMGRYLYCLAIAEPRRLAGLQADHPPALSGGRVVGAIAAMPGLIGGLLLLALCAKLFRVRLVTYLELTIPFICYMHAWGAAGLFPRRLLPRSTDGSFSRNTIPTGKPGMSGTRRRSGSPHATLRNVSTDRAGCGYANPNHPKPPDHGLPDWLRAGPILH